MTDECDYEFPVLVSQVKMPDGTYRCRCGICARCGHHTGNSHQGHYWSQCSKSKKLEKPHFCCPTLECEL